MEKEMDDLSSLWKQTKGVNSGSSALSAAEIISQAEQKKKALLMAHYINIGILAAVAIMVAAFLLGFFPFATLLSKTGVYLMITVPIVRIGIEILSLSRSRRIRVADASVKATEDSLAFYRFRKKLHGTVTIALVGFYILGWFMLTPEYSKYIPLPWMIVLDGGFVVIAAVLIIVIRNGLKQEIAELGRMVELQRQLIS